MTGEDGPVQHCEMSEPVNLLTALAAAGIEHLDVDEHRTIMIYQHAILMVIATEGKATTARVFDVELWESPAHDPNRDPDTLLSAFIDELMATTGITRH